MNDLFLRACRGEAVERLPVWIMRQAGRYLPEYRAVRANADFLTLCKTPELATEVTLQPIRILGVDAAILFADILLPLEAMGAQLVFAKGDGPQFPNPVRSTADLGRLRPADVEKDLGYVLAAIRSIRRELANLGGDRHVPLIGFGGSPWTLAAYLVEGGTSKNYEKLRAWTYADPAGLRQLLDMLAETSARYLAAQVDAGAQAIQLFDTWGGLLDAKRYRELVVPAIQRTLEPIVGKVPLIYYLQDGAHLLEETRALPVDVVGVDWRLPLDEVRPRVGMGRALQGNLDPTALLSSPERIEEEVATMLRQGAGGPHIANLGHGILQPTPVENAQRFVSAVQRLSRREPMPAEGVADASADAPPASDAPAES